METKTFKDFWKELDIQARDELRKKLATALFISTTTVTAYGYAAREVPKAKQNAIRNIIKERYQINITF